MPWTSDLLAGIAQHLAEHAGATYKASGTYSSTDPRPIAFQSIPAKPDEVIALFPYTVEEDAGLNDVIQGVQIRTRGTRSPSTLRDLDDDIFDALHGLRGITLNGVPVVLIYRQSASPLGSDTNGRFESTANYYVQAARPSPHRLD